MICVTGLTHCQKYGEGHKQRSIASGALAPGDKGQIQFRYEFCGSFSILYLNFHDTNQLLSKKKG